MILMAFAHWVSSPNVMMQPMQKHPILWRRCAEISLVGVTFVARDFVVRHMWVSHIAKKGCFYDMVVDALSDVDDLIFEKNLAHLMTYKFPNLP